MDEVCVSDAINEGGVCDEAGGDTCLSGDCIVGGDCTTTANDTSTGGSNLDAICLDGGQHWNDANGMCGLACIGIGACVTRCLQNIPTDGFNYGAVDPAVNEACATCYGAIQTCIGQFCVWRLADGVTNCAQGDPNCAPTGPCAPPNDPLGAACNACQATNGCDVAFEACAGDTAAACTAFSTPPN